MKRKTLEDMGLTKEQVDTIMAENGADIESAKGNLTQITQERDNYKAQLDKANSTIEGFKDYDQVKAQVEDYKSKYEQSKLDYETKISNMQFDSALEAAISAVGGKSAKAIRAMLDIDSLKASKDQTADIKAALESCRTDNGYLFGSDEPIQNPVGGTGGTPPATHKKLEDMTYEEYKAYRSEK